MRDLLTPTDESVLQMASATLRSFDRATLAEELNRVAAKFEWALGEARERGYDDAKSTELPSTANLEGDFRRWKELNPSADLRSAWIAAIVNERKASLPRTEALIAAGDALRDAVNGLDHKIKLASKCPVCVAANNWTRAAVAALHPASEEEK